MPVSGGPDTIDYHLPAFSFINQDSSIIDESVIKDKLLVVEFFFTSCPSICPKMQKEMLRVYDKYKTDPDLLILAYSIDPARDTVGKLKSYADKLGIETSKWHMLTGDKDSIYELADKFLVSAAEDPDAPGGHVHSGTFILVDKKKRIRGYYDGTDEKSVEKLLSEIDILKQEPADAVLKKTVY
jgi:protein SCO1